MIRVEEVGRIMSSGFNMLSLRSLLVVPTKQLDISCFGISKIAAELETWLEISHQHIVILEIQRMDNIFQREWIEAQRKKASQIIRSVMVTELRKSFSKEGRNQQDQMLQGNKDRYG